MRCRPLWLTLTLAGMLLLAAPAPASAYIGPGAGFALVSSAFVLVTTFFVVAFTLLAWPFRAAWRLLTLPARPKAAITRFVVVGLDGQDPKLTDQFMREGLLPNFSALAKEGSYRRLKTTFPSLSPVAWSSFSTGAHPARHNIFDFLDRDRRTYLPMLSSTRIGKVERFLKLGRYRIPLQKPELRLLRRSKPFWTILGEHRIWSTVLRVPITFPPDSFYGAELSAMCVPDLLGTQGTFLLYTTRPPAEKFKEGGVRIHVSLTGDRIDSTLEGPENTFLEGSPPLVAADSGRPRSRRLARDRDDRRHRDRPEAGRAERLGGTRSSRRCPAWVSRASPACSSPRWASISRSTWRPSTSIPNRRRCRSRIRPTTPPTSPRRWARSPRSASPRIRGRLNEGVTDDGTFLQQTYDIDRERESMFFAALDRLREGALVCVFDATDRIQHMFWRDIDPGHPAGRGREKAAAQATPSASCTVTTTRWSAACGRN